MKCIIVDDEPLARTGIQLLLEEYSDLKVVGSFNQAASALAFLMLNPVDLIFLDIRMPGMNGLELARSIGKNTMIIFVTAFSEYALDSYQVDAIDYLVKPIQPERFHQAVRKALDYTVLLEQANQNTSLEFSSDYIMVRADRQFIKIKHNDIFYIEGLKDYVILFLKDSKIITNMNLKMIHHELPQNQFIRVSKSYIVNSLYVNVFNNNTITILDKEIPIGNIYREDFLDRVVRKK
ncbi:LytR/AlgR family response regulator transcription factor [Flavobacterium sp. FlaQc-48]|uniref:LytR/AlgR family response regulator transcription factor n=1 Tax=Flavobacterium sp. FlaQc-48 TaxID=3374181 RepID=UPI003757ABD1